MTPKLIIISGTSGAGKSSALRLLEDEGYYCVDNLPPRLLPEFSEEMLEHPEYRRFHGIAVGIDARTIGIEHEHETEPAFQTPQPRRAARAHAAVPRRRDEAAW